MHRGLWLPRCRKKPFFPLCPCRTAGHTRSGNSARLPPSRHTAYAPSGITHTRSQHFASALQDFCSNSLRAAHFVVRAVYDTVVLGLVDLAKQVLGMVLSSAFPDQLC